MDTIIKCAVSISDTERIATLRARCRYRKTLAWGDKTLIDYHSFQASASIQSLKIRIGRRTRDRLEQFRFDLDDLELLVGRPAPKPVDLDEAEYQQAKEYLSHLPFASTPGQAGHCELNRNIVLQNGIDGALKLLRDKQDAAQTSEQRDTYQSFIDALTGLQRLVENAAQTAKDAMSTASAERQQELAEMARSCDHCAHHPPETFREALQLTWLIDVAVAYADNAWLISPGHLDRTLYPYYEDAAARGSLSQADALRLIESYYLLINEFVPDGLAVAVMVGGVDAAGRDLTNDLSYLCLETLRRTKLVYPTVGVCWTERTPRSLVALAIELISQGYSNPAFFNDQTIQKGLQKYGVPAVESWNYCNSTCVEITPVGSSNVWVASPYFPVCQYLLDEIEARANSADALSGSCPAGTFGDFLDAYFRRLGEAIALAVGEQNRYRSERERYGGKPLQSVFTSDCVERGLDIDRGGARYNWVECSFVGLANLVDSLQVIRKEIYESNRPSFTALNALLKTDFAGREMERNRFLKSYEKYGHNAGQVDALMNTIVGYFEGECAKHCITPDDAHFVPGAFCWIMHEELGKVCGATPDGRRAGTPFADGCGPAQGRELYGPTAAILSTTSWDHSPLIGGAAFNMKFSRQVIQDQTGQACLRDLIVTFLKRGGFEVQINVVDKDMMKNAKAFPEQYQDLVVRIGGYTDYFVRLSPRMQDELISRTEYSTF
jgi:pyruvate-formate lyase